MGTESTTFFNNLRDFPIFNFDMCMKGELNYIYQSRKGEVTEDIKSLWDDLYNEYFQLTSNSEHQQYFRLVLEVRWLKNRLIYAPILIDLAFKTPEKERKLVFDELKKWKLNIKTEKDLEKAAAILNNSKTKIKRKESELQELNEKNEKLSTNKISLESQAVKIYKRIGLKPDIFKDSVLTWLAYWDEIKELNKSNG